MLPDAEDFKLAIKNYAFPNAEPIYDVPFVLPTCDLSVFRSSHGQVPPHATLAEFWASALFGYLENHGEDDRFEELGGSGIYEFLEQPNAGRLVSAMVGCAQSKFISVPQDVELCYLVRQDPELSVAIGVDRSGYFALFCRPRAG